MAGTPGNPDERLLDELDEIRRQLRALARRAPQYVVVEGPRTDIAGGRGPRARFGLLSDGTYGAERWTAAGVRTVATFA